MSEKPKSKPKATSIEAARTALQRRREPPKDLPEPQFDGLIQLPDSQELAQSQMEQRNHRHFDETTEESSIGRERIVTVPISKIRPGRYQKRETVDAEKYQQLKDQIQELGLNFVALLCPDPDDNKFYNLMMGGHLRLQAAGELGIAEVSAIIREHDRTALAKGTYFENNGRQQLTPMEEGLIFQQCIKDEGWNQIELAKKLMVSGGNDYVSFCIKATKAAPDIQEMLRKEPGRGRRCFTYLQRLDALGQEKAMKLREPIIKAFLEGNLSTDEIEVKIDRILKRGEDEENADKENIEDIKQQTKILNAERHIDGLDKKIGSSAPSPLVRESLLRLKEKIENILARGQ